jgi:hypothetical protein
MKLRRALWVAVSTAVSALLLWDHSGAAHRPQAQARR